MSTIEVELWNIFTCYTLHGNPRDPSRISETQFLKLCKDSSVMNPAMVDAPLNQATLHLIWTSELKSVGNADSDRLEYKEFLSCLIGVANHCYPNCRNSEESMQQLLMDNILPMAARRRPVAMDGIVMQPQVEELFFYYEEALQEIYHFYATNTENISRNMIKSTGSTSKAKSFDEQKSLLAAAKEKTQSRSGSSSRMEYPDFLRFASDFGLANSMALTSLDLGDIFLTVISTQSFETSLRSITFREFWEVLIRCALVAFRKTKGHISTVNKLKGMFLYLWRHMQHCIQENQQGDGHRSGSVGGFTIFHGGLLRGSKILNERFIMAWNKDGFRDYLESGDGGAVVDENIDRPVETVIGIPITRGAKDGSRRSRGQGGVSPLPTDRTSPAVSFHRATSSASSPMKPFSGAGGGPQVAVYINDSDVFPDERIKAPQLRRFLQSRPDMAQLLWECVVQEGLDLDEEDEEEVGL